MSEVKMRPPAIGANGDVKTAGVRLEVIERWVRIGSIAAVVCAACLSVIAAVQVGEAARFAYTRAAFRDSMTKFDKDMAKVFTPKKDARSRP